MHVLRFLLRAVPLLLWLAWGLLAVGLLYPWLGLPARDRLNRIWSRGLLWVCGLRVTCEGVPRREGATLWVANHVSWLDIFVLNSVRPTAFVAKQEIRRWPVIGWLVAGAGTLFIDRRQRHAVHSMGQAMQSRFARGEVVGLFPEGTTSDGLALRPFHASLFEPACQHAVPVQPVVLRFRQHGERSGYAAFIGEETLVANLWRVLGTTGLSVDAVFLDDVPTRLPDGSVRARNDVSAQAREAMVAALG